MTRFSDPALKIPGSAHRHSLHLWRQGDVGIYTVALQTETWVRGERRFFLHETINSAQLGVIQCSGDLWSAVADLGDQYRPALF